MQTLSTIQNKYPMLGMSSQSTTRYSEDLQEWHRLKNVSLALLVELYKKKQYSIFFIYY